MKQFPYGQVFAIIAIVAVVSVTVTYFSGGQPESAQSGDCFSVDDILANRVIGDTTVACSDYAEILKMTLNEEPWDFNDYQGDQIYHYSLVKSLIRPMMGILDRWDIKFRSDGTAIVFFRILTELSNKQWFDQDRYEIYSHFIFNEMAIQMSRELVTTEAERSDLENIFRRHDFSVTNYDIDSMAKCFFVIDVFSYEISAILNSNIYKECLDS